jgi:The GLUG motif
MKTIPSSGAGRHLVRLGIFLIVVVFVAVMAGCTPISIEIWDWYDLDAIRDNMRGSYILMDDLDSTTAGYDESASPTANEGKGWQPIGSMAVNDTFAGSFDGQGYEIRDLFIDRADESDVGLFGVVGEGGIIENVAMVSGNMTGYGDVGSLVGYNRGSVRNSYACSSVTGNLNVGGFVGVNGGTVSNSYSGGSTTGGDDVGGLVGKNEGTVSNSYSTGAVNGNDFVGDLVGINGGTVSNSYTSGTVNGSNFVGGLAGRNEGTVSMCHSTGSVIGDEYAGGLLGQNLYGVVSNSFWDTETSGQGSSDDGIGKTTTEMQDITTFTGAGWDIIAVADSNARNTGYVWNIVDDATYPFLSWQPP